MIPSRTDASGLGSVNSGLFFRNGVRPGLVSPIWGKTGAPPGTVFGRYGPHKTSVEEPANSPREQQYRTLFEDDVTGQPWTAPEPEFNVGGGPYGAEGAALMNHPASTRISGDLRTSLEKSLVSTSQWNVPEYLRGQWANNPIATLFFGFAAIWIAWEILFNPPNESRGVQGAASSAGRTVAAPGAAVAGAATGAASKSADTVTETATDVVGGAVDTVEDAVEAVLPG